MDSSACKEEQAERKYLVKVFEILDTADAVVVVVVVVDVVVVHLQQ